MQEDHVTAGCALFSRTLNSPRRRPGQRLMIVTGGERNGPQPTTRSGDDDKGFRERPIEWRYFRFDKIQNGG